MFRLRYLLSELRRRRGRTVLTALGLGVGVGLVVAVSALSAGLDEAQQEVLEPLTGVGTDMSVNRPISFEGDSDGGPPQISEAEQERLQEENGGGQLDFSELGDPGEEFSTDRFLSQDISFGNNQVEKVAGLDGVEAVSPSLSVNLIEIEGTIPEASSGEGGGPGFGGPPPGGGGERGGFGLDPLSITGIEPTDTDLGAVSADQLADGSFLDARDEAMVSSSYAAENGVSVGDRVDVAGKKLEVVGIVTAPIGADASDVYMDLGRLQSLSDRERRVNGLEVRATDVDAVDSVAAGIESAFSGSEVTTASDLADSISGSLVDAKDLSSTLGTALSAVSLLGAFAIAGLLTLSAINKRTREIGTLKALGWRQSRVVSQITGESVAQGLLGGAVGTALGLGAAALIGSLGISLQATAETAGGPGFGPGPGGPPGAGAETVSDTVQLGAPIDPSLIVLAVGLAVAGGLVAGAVGGIRSARLRPAEALRSVE